MRVKTSTVARSYFLLSLRCSNNKLQHVVVIYPGDRGSWGYFRHSVDADVPAGEGRS